MDNLKTAAQPLNQALQRGVLFTLLAVLVLSLSACGFHLKGTGQQGLYGFKSIQIITNSATHSDLLVTLKRQLTASNIDVVSSQSLQPYFVLELDNTQLKSTTTSTNGLGAETSELMTMSQAYVVSDPKTNKVIAKDTAKVWRDRLINNAARLASESELRQIRAQMRADLAQQILQRLQRIERQAVLLNSMKSGQ